MTPTEEVLVNRALQKDTRGGSQPLAGGSTARAEILQVNTETLRSYLLSGARRMGLPITAQHADRLARHVIACAAEDAVILHGPELPKMRGQVLVGLARGESAAATARRLFVHVDTVKKHRQRLYEALDVSTGTAAVAAAYRCGLLKVPARRAVPAGRRA
ncbi:hypothetical protein [Streptomyces sp. NPDC050264]|uniref:response regulator transcription factor n=1 Tax=Streptomyces sp. NPDC050264 TaxID=3155038 RepID=UPI0034130B88